ncbi:PKD domain-containing protein [Candidatus Bathyarchaeota archaeon]|nr:PKD domain-containing protein [Candidatus Bathyarchaeota archaeon]
MSTKMKHPSKNVIAILAIFSAFIAIIGFIPKSSMNVDETRRVPIFINPPPRPSMLHPRISLEGNEALEAFPNKTGNGISTDPYVIENLTIDGEGMTGISLSSIDRYLLIDNCTITNAGNAIDVDNCSNVHIENCSLKDNVNGIYAQNSSYINCTSNTIQASILFGIHFHFSHDYSISENDLIDNMYGSVTSLCFNGKITQNVLLNNSETGLVMENSSHLIVRKNDIRFNKEHGISIRSSTNNTVEQNTIEQNGIYGLILKGNSTSNRIMLNTFLENPISNAFIDGNASGNTWDDGSFGNYWDDFTLLHPSDYSEPIRFDAPYPINGSSIDMDNAALRYPIGTSHWLIPNMTSNATTIKPGESIIFRYRGVNSSEIASFTWEFGDGTNGSGEIASHDYTSPGTYTVSLYVTDALGFQATVKNTGYITVSGKSAVLEPEIFVFIFGLSMGAIGLTSTMVVKYRRSRNLQTRKKREMKGKKLPTVESKKNGNNRYSTVPMVNHILGTTSMEGADAFNQEGVSSSDGKVEIGPACLIHKKPVDGLSYTCSKCHVTYCLECATMLVEKRFSCLKCNYPISLNGKGTLHGVNSMDKPMHPGIAIMDGELLDKVRQLRENRIITEEIIDEIFMFLAFLPPADRVPFLQKVFSMDSFHTPSHIDDDEIAILSRDARVLIFILEREGLLTGEIREEVFRKLAGMEVEQHVQFLKRVFLTNDPGDDECSPQELSLSNAPISILSTDVLDYLESLESDGIITGGVINEITNHLARIPAKERLKWLKRVFQHKRKGEDHDG